MEKKKLCNLLVLTAVSLFCVYLFEYSLGFFLTKSLVLNPVPPHSTQEHKTSEYSVTYTYNNYSLRSDDMNFTKKYDIVLLGDSFLFGQGVNIDKTLYAYLKSAGYNVLNTSEIATNPIQYYHKLKILNTYKLKASHFIVGLFIGNDFMHIADKNIEHALKYQYEKNPLEYDFMSFLKMQRLNYLIYGISKKLENAIIVHKFEWKKDFQRSWLKWYTQDDKNAMKLMFKRKYQRMDEDTFLLSAQINASSIKKIIRIINETHNSLPLYSKLHIMLIPDIHHANGETSTQYEKMIDLLVDGFDNRINVVDLHKIVTSDMYYKNDGHWNVRGHKVVAEYITQNVLMAKEQKFKSRQLNTRL